MPRLVVKTDGNPDHTSLFINDREVKDAIGVSISLVGGEPAYAKVHFLKETQVFDSVVILPPSEGDVDLIFA